MLSVLYYFLSFCKRSFRFVFIIFILSQQAKSLFETDENNFLQNLTKDGIYYDTRNKRFLISADASRLSQLTTKKNTINASDSKELAALQSNITKREVILDSDPDIVSKMGGKVAQKERDSVEKAEEVYRFARQILDIVDDPVVINKTHPIKAKVKRESDVEKSANEKYHKISGNIKGIWAGLGSIPEFEPDLIRREVKAKAETIDDKKPVDQLRHHLSLKEIRQKRSNFVNYYHKNNDTGWSRNLGDVQDTVNKEKRSTIQQKLQEQHIESPVSVTETGSLGSVNLQRTDTVTEESRRQGEEEVYHQKVKREQEENRETRSYRISAASKTDYEELFHQKTKREDIGSSPANNAAGKPASSDDGKVIFAFDEVKELLPARVSHQADFDGVETARSTLLQPQSVTETRYNDVDKDLAESMLVNREKIPVAGTRPSFIGTTLSHPATLTATLYPDEGSSATSSYPEVTDISGTTDGIEKLFSAGGSEANYKNKIPIIRKDNRIGPAQFSKYKADYERPRMEQMRQWVNETMLYPSGNEQTEETDAALQKLNLASLNASTMYPSYTDSKGESSSEYLAKNLQDKIKTEYGSSATSNTENSEVGIDELNRDILKEQQKYKTYLENQRLQRIRDQQKAQNGDDSETQSQSTQKLGSSAPSFPIPMAKVNKENSLEHSERVHKVDTNTNTTNSSPHQEQKEGALEHFERVHSLKNDSYETNINTTLGTATTPAPAQITTATIVVTSPTATTIAQIQQSTLLTTSSPSITATATTATNSTTSPSPKPPSLSIITPPTEATPLTTTLTTIMNNNSDNQTSQQQHNNTSISSDQQQFNNSTIQTSNLNTTSNRQSVENADPQQQQQQSTQPTVNSTAQHQLTSWQQGTTF